MVHIVQHTCFTETLNVKGHEKRPKKSKWSNYGSVMKLADYSHPIHTGNITHQDAQNVEPTVRFTSGGVVRVVLFFLHHGFVPLSFLDKVLMRQHEAYYKSCMVMASKGECYKSLCGWPITNDQDKAQSWPKEERERQSSKERETVGLDRLRLRTFSFYLFQIFSYFILYQVFDNFFFPILCNSYIKNLYCSLITHRNIQCLNFLITTLSCNIKDEK